MSKGHGSSQTLQMMWRRLLTEDEIMQLEKGTFLILKAGCPPAQTTLPMYWDYLPKFKDYIPPSGNVVLTKNAYLTAEKIQSLAKMGKYKINKGMFD